MESPWGALPAGKKVTGNGVGEAKSALLIARRFGASPIVNVSREEPARITALGEGCTGTGQAGAGGGGSRSRSGTTCACLVLF